MATGDILSCEVLATGWQVKVVIDNFVDGGTYDFGDLDADVANAKFTMTVVSEGYNTAGTLGTITRTVYGTRVCQQAYPNQATREETEAAGDVELTIALSDYVYDDDNTGAGKSGTAPTVTIASGWYTDNGTGGSSAANNAATNLTVTNSSTQDYPKAIARWAVVPYQRVTSTFALEVVAFHRFAANGKPVACVKFSHTDGATDVAYATAMVKSSAADSLPCYRRTITASDYTDNTAYTWQFTAYPWVGDADSVITTVGGTANALTLGPLPLFMDSDDDYPAYIACVNTSTGNDTTGVASTTYATADASPCATIRGAMTKINTATGSGLDAGVIYLQSNNHNWTDGTDSVQTATNVWLTITRDPSVAKANAVITTSAAGALRGSKVRLYDLTIVPTGLHISGAAGRVIWLDAVHVEPSSQLASNWISGYDLGYYTACTASAVDYPFANYSSTYNPSLIRGCSAALARGFSNSAAYGASCTLTSAITSASPNGSAIFLAFPRENSIAAYNTRWDGSAAGPMADDTAADHTAMVCNLLEAITGIANVATTEGGGVARTPATNKIVWHNTVVGERWFIGYNEQPATNRQISNVSLKFNAAEYLTTKHDVFATDGSLTGGWSVLYGVGWVGNHSERDTSAFQANYGGPRSTWQSAAGYVDDQSLTTAGAGNGDYRPASGAVLRNKIASAADVVIPWDLDGRAYRAGSAAGAYSGVGPGTRLWSY